MKGDVRKGMIEVRVFSTNVFVEEIVTLDWSKHENELLRTRASHVPPKTVDIIIFSPFVCVSFRFNYIILF